MFSTRSVSYYVCFAAPFYKKLRKDQPKQLDRLYKNKSSVVVSLIEALRSTLLLALRNTTGLYNLNSNVCYEQIRSALVQVHKDGSKLPDSYCFLILNNRKQKLSVMHRQCLAVAHAIFLFLRSVKVTRLTVKTGLLGLPFILSIIEVSDNGVLRT